MANTIKVKQSAVASKIPVVADLALGELAVNTYDGKLFMKMDSGAPAIKEIGAGGGTNNVDGGFANSVYTTPQLIDGGAA